MKYVAFNISILYLYLHLLFIAVFQKDSLLRRISIRRLSVARMTHFAGKCFLFNLHLKRMKFGLFCKATCFKQKANHNKLNKNFFDFRSSHQRCSVRKDALKNFANFTEKTPVLESLFNKVADLFSPATLLKRDSNKGFFL